MREGRMEKYLMDQLATLGDDLSWQEIEELVGSRPEELKDEEALAAYFKEENWPSLDYALLRFAALCYRQKGDRVKFYEWMQRAMEEGSNLREPCLQMVMTAYEHQEWEVVYHKCLRALSLTTQAGPYYGEALCWTTTYFDDALAFAAIQLNQIEVAKKHTLICLNNFPDDVRFQNNLRWLEEKVPEVSVIILCRNQLGYTQKCLESLRSHTHIHYEVIVVDNASNDGTENWLTGQPNLKVIRNEENLGFPKGCNQGIQLARGENILLLNNDTVLTQDWLTNLLISLNSSEDVGAVGPVTNNASYSTAIHTDYGDDLSRMQAFARDFNQSDPSKWEQRTKLIGFCLLIKRKALDAAGTWLDETFSPGNYEDDDLSLRLIEQGYKLLLCRDTFIHHFGSVSWKEDPIGWQLLLHENNEKFKQKWTFGSELSTIDGGVLSILHNFNPTADRVLEIGCGVGANMLAALSSFPQLRLEGVEENPLAAKLAAKHLPAMGLSYDKLLEHYGDQRFNYVIIHAPLTLDRFNEVYEMALSLRVPGGQVILSSHNWGIYQEWLNRDKKVLFVACVDNEELWAQCERQIRSQVLPEGHSLEIMVIRDAKSMTEGYNRALSHPAKYKIYLHQDLFITNRSMTMEVIRHFQENAKLGLIGVAGVEQLPDNAIWWEGRTVGKVLEYRDETFSWLALHHEGPDQGLHHVEAIDGMLMATQYDLPWREDLFDGFHFYDTSQSLEFLKAGYEVAIPAKSHDWCLHYNQEVKHHQGFNDEAYHIQRQIFLEAYKPNTG